MSKLKVLIVEDEILIADMIEEYLLEKGYQITDLAISYDEAEKSYLREKPDLALLDIRLSGAKTGVDFAHFIQSQPQPCPHIYLTSQIDQKNIDAAKETFPSGYLPKPIQKEVLYTTMEIAIYNHRMTQEAAATILLSDGTIKNRVLVQDILFIRGDHVYLEVNMKDQTKILHRSTFKDIFEQLPIDQFFQSHRSFIVNFKHISRWDHTNIYIQEYQIPISRSQRKKVLDFLENRG